VNSCESSAGLSAKTPIYPANTMVSHRFGIWPPVRSVTAGPGTDSIVDWKSPDAEQPTPTIGQLKPALRGGTGRGVVGVLGVSPRRVLALPCRLAHSHFFGD
jgi:hypothetical protein